MENKINLGDKENYNFEKEFEKTSDPEIKVPVEKFFNELHPEVFLIPKDRHFHIVNKQGLSLESERQIFPFSSLDIYIDFHKEQKDVFQEFYHLKAFSRLANIGKRDHSILTAALMEVILARNGFSKNERDAAVLTAACHDIAMPAGGNLTQEIDYKNLNKEENFSLAMERSGLIEKWNKQFGFDILLASDWVKNKHLIGKLLDVLDKISYVALDCYHIRKLSQQQKIKSQIHSICACHPLIMDVWQDIQFLPDKTNFGFSNPDKLFNFLLLRAHTFKEVFKNPDSKTLEYFLAQKSKLLYEKGIVTKEQLLTNDDQWLMSILNKYYFEEIKKYLEPGALCWKRFSTLEEQEEFIFQKENKIIHSIYDAGFSAGLDLPIISQDEETVKPIRKVINNESIDQLKEIAEPMGYYVYYKK